TSYCLALLARANRQKGDYDAAINADEKILQLGQQWNDQAQIALGHTEIGSVLARQEKYVEALDHYRQAHVIYTSQGVQRSIGFNLQARANVLWQLGRYQEAKTLLDEAAAIADKPGGGYKKLSIQVKLVAAEIALSQGSFADARARAETVLTMAGAEFPDLASGAKRLLGLAQSSTGAKAAGKQLAKDAVEVARKLNDPYQLATAQLALAEAMLLAGDSRAASSNALQAQEVFAQLGQPASEWRALLVAAQASHNSGDKNMEREYSMRARDLLSKLEQRWGSENYKSYLSRTDIQRSRKQLDQLAGSA
ncbi:MAG: tetratricopeptide repeat protein, partial [Acidobacteria bacterium]|nr:tetratricopeptide repeat protein [Acidobacteriota bacterium]